MPHRIALSKEAVRPVPLTRNAAGRVTAFMATRTAVFPSLYTWVTGYTNIAAFPTKQWGLCIQDEDTLYDPTGAAGDVDTILMPAGWLMDTVLTAPMATGANNALAQTDLGVVAVAGQTVYDLLNSVLLALGQSPGAVDYIVLT